MYFGKPKDTIEWIGGWPIAAAVSVCVFLTVYFGINSAPLSSRAHAAARAAVPHPLPNVASVAERGDTHLPVPSVRSGRCLPRDFHVVCVHGREVLD